MQSYNPSQGAKCRPPTPQGAGMILPWGRGGWDAHSLICLRSPDPTTSKSEVLTSILVHLLVYKLTYNLLSEGLIAYHTSIIRE
jgi:hypothetical protein